jgi:hypothetical protein
MNRISRVTLAAIVCVRLLAAQQPGVVISNAPQGLTLTVASPGGITQIDAATFRFYMDGADVTAQFTAFALSGNPLVSLQVTANAVEVSIAANLTAFHFAAQACTFGGLCGAHNLTLETFGATTMRDATFVQTFGTQQARWHAGTAPGMLAGRALSGSPAGPLGTRVQFTVDPQPPSQVPAGLFSPFDASAAGSGGQCGTQGCNLGPGINPQGGSHIMHLYEASELSNHEDSLEQVEWAPVNFSTVATVYPNYRVWCGVTSITAPMSGGAAGMNPVFDMNYLLTPYQTGIPLQPGCGNPAFPNARKVHCGGPAPYVVSQSVTQFYAFPPFSPCFDFSTSTGASGAGVNLLLEQDIAPGSQAPNFSRYRATAFQPVRRLLDRPLSTLPNPSVCPVNQGGTFDIYKMRFTFVGLAGQARSLWYDTGLVDPTYQSFILSPPLGSQPAGTQSTWILEGTDVANPQPATIGASGVYINAAGVTNPAVLSGTLAAQRYFRFRVELRGNNVTNAAPSYTSVSMVFF